MKSQKPIEIRDACKKAAGKTVECRTIEVPKDVCELKFGGKQKDIVSTEEFTTIRNEMMFVHFNKKGKVISIELIDDKKPCQLY